MRRFRVYVLLALVATLTGAQDGTTRSAARSQSHAPMLDLWHARQISVSQLLVSQCSAPQILPPNDC